MSDKKISQLTSAATPLAGTEVLPIVQSGATVKVTVGNLTDGLNTVTVPKGGTGLTSLSTGYIPYGNGTSALSSSANLQFDGTNLTIGGVSADKIIASPQAVDSGFKFLVVNTANNAYKPLAFEGSKVELYYAGVKGAELLSNGNLAVNTGNLVIGTAGKGIDFSADPSAAGMTSELLDDYEEGTWTPVDASGSLGAAFAFAAGNYTKIGRMMFASFMIIYPASADTANAAIGGLPFSSMSGNQTGGSSITYTDVGFSISLLNGAAASTVLISNSSGVFLTNANMAGKIIRGTLSYMV